MQRNIQFDVIRALSMVYIVFIWHLSGVLGFSLDKYPVLFLLTNTALGIFFAISGYFMGRYEFHYAKDWFRYYIKRILRIIPMAGFALVSFYYSYPVSEMSVKKAVYCITGALPFTSTTIPTLWFIGMLIFFYLITPFILSMKNDERKLILFVVLFSLCFIFEYLKGCEIDNRIFLFFPCYFTGLMFSKQTPEEICSFFTASKTLLLTAIFAAMSYPAYNNGNVYSKVVLFQNIIGIYSGFAIFFFISQKLSTIKTFQRIISFLAYVSFGAYLFHRPIFYCITRYTNNNVIVAICAIFATLSVSFIVQKCCDPIKRLFSNIY